MSPSPADAAQAPLPAWGGTSMPHVLRLTASSRGGHVRAPRAAKARMPAAAACSLLPPWRPMRVSGLARTMTAMRTCSLHGGQCGSPAACPTRLQRKKRHDARAPQCPPQAGARVGMAQGLHPAQRRAPSPAAARPSPCPAGRRGRGRHGARHGERTSRLVGTARTTPSPSHPRGCGHSSGRAGSPPPRPHPRAPVASAPAASCPARRGRDVRSPCRWSVRRPPTSRRR